MSSRANAILAFFLLLALLPQSACSLLSSSDLTDVPDLAPETEMDLFVARGFLGGSGYEHYHLAANKLWRECGNVDVKKNKNRVRASVRGDELLNSDPNLQIVERRFETLKKRQRKLLSKHLQELTIAAEASKKKLPLPGSVQSLAGPGLLELQIDSAASELQLVTSVDAISDAQVGMLKRAQELVEVIRGIGPVICQSTTFFGIGREKRAN